MKKEIKPCKGQESERGTLLILGGGGAEVMTREQNEVRREPREYLRKARAFPTERTASAKALKQEGSVLEVDNVAVR